MADSGLKGPQLGINFSISSRCFASTIPVPKSVPKWQLCSTFFSFIFVLRFWYLFELNLIQQIMGIDENNFIVDTIF